MKPLTKNQIEFMDGIIDGVYLSDFLYQEDDNIHDWDDFVELLESSLAFDVEIIYYYEAMKYLSAKDQSLYESMQLAAEHGYNIEQISSELLATLHASNKAREQFNEASEELRKILNL